MRHTARTWNFDGYLASTLAPGPVQRDVMAIAAFVGELERIRFTVSEPTLAQIRVQWWRDELQRMIGVGASDHPIGEALLSAIRAHNLPIGLAVGIADAVADQLSEPQLADAQRLNAWFGKRYGAPMALSARCIASDVNEGAIAAAGRTVGYSQLVARSRESVNLAVALGITASVEELAQSATDSKVELVNSLRHVSRRHRVAFLPASLSKLYLNHSEGRPGSLSKVLRMASAHWLGRF